MKKVILAMLLGSLLTTYLQVYPIYAEEKLTKIAVYQLKTRGVKDDLVSDITKRLRQAIGEKSSFLVLSRGDMELLLSKAAEKPGIELGCQAVPCLVEIAKVLGVNLIITGNIGKMGRTYVTSLRLIDADSAQTLNTISRGCPCPENELIDIISSMGLDLLRTNKPPSAASYPIERNISLTPPGSIDKAAAQPLPKITSAARVFLQEKEISPQAGSRRASLTPPATPPEEKTDRPDELSPSEERVAKITPPEKNQALPTKRKRKLTSRWSHRKKTTSRLSSNNWLWWSLGAIVVVGGAAAFAGGSAPATDSGGGGSGGGGATQTTGNAHFTW